VIRQGQLYQYRHQRVIAVQANPGRGTVRCLRIEPNHPSGVGPVFWATAAELVALPMKYHGGQIP
jgi:hypothetical protein